MISREVPAPIGNSYPAYMNDYSAFGSRLLEGRGQAGGRLQSGSEPNTTRILREKWGRPQRRRGNAAHFPTILTMNPPRRSPLIPTLQRLLPLGRLFIQQSTVASWRWSKPLALEQSRLRAVQPVLPYAALRVNAPGRFLLGKVQFVQQFVQQFQLGVMPPCFPVPRRTMPPPSHELHNCCHNYSSPNRKCNETAGCRLARG